MDVIEEIPFQPEKRTFLREPFLSASHLFGALANLIAITLLVTLTNCNYLKLLPTILYGATLIFLFLSSGLFHGIKCTNKNLIRLERLDYISIYLFIAGTYTPLCFFILKGNSGLATLIFEWTAAFIGVFTTLKWGFGKKSTQILIFLAMGWGFIFSYSEIINSFTSLETTMLILGALSYTMGAFIFAFAPARVTKHNICTHSIWHILVLLGSSSHLVMISLITQNRC